MYTVEFEKDASVVTSLDETGRYEDVEMVISDDDTVYLRQYETSLNEHQIIYISYQQLLDLESIQLRVIMRQKLYVLALPLILLILGTYHIIKVLELLAILIQQITF